MRACVEGTIAQGVPRRGMRRSRYRGLTKTSLQHQLTGAAINLARIDAWLSVTSHARTRGSHFAALQQSENRATPTELMAAAPLRLCRCRMANWA
ncbi:transposase [Streptomyces sp. NPDC001933]|uniref:transposase n=1 Tax=Streptomyces sp. NPDC001933 TaxID=3364626 RepID=UPI0036A7AE5B